MSKPFDPEHPIEDPSRFWGRQAELSKIFSRINADHPQSISIVGERKIGKSSLINAIGNPIVYDQYLNHPENYIFIQFEIDDDVVNVDSFFEKLVSTISGSADSSSQIKDSKGGYQFLKNFINISMEEGKKIVMLLDDFDKITGNSEFPLEFFSFLRSVANSYKIAYVTTSSQPLQKVCIIKDVKESPFFNIFSSFGLKLLELKNIQKPAMEILENHNISEDGRNFFWETAAHHPYVMQVVGSLLIDHNGSVDESMAMEQLRDFFNQIWDSLSPEERDCMDLLARDKRLPEKLRYVAQELWKRSLLLENGADWLLFSPLYKVFILQIQGGWLSRIFKMRKQQ